MPWELRACDNMDPVAGLGSLPEHLVDVVITDPPYSPKVHACSRRGASGYRKHGSAGACADRVRELGFGPLMLEERAAMARELNRITWSAAGALDSAKDTFLGVPEVSGRASACDWRRCRGRRC
jgi:hypothetical protein